MSPFGLFGRDIDKHFNLDNVMQPDLLLVSDSTVFSIEMKITAKCTVSQVLKYALLGLAVELQTERERNHCFLIIGPGPFSSLWCERIHYPGELREALLAVDPTEFLAGKHKRYREHVVRFRQIIESIALAHTTYADLSNFIAQESPDTADTSVGAEVYRKLISGLIDEFARRQLLVSMPRGEGGAMLPDGTVTANALHEQMTEGVDDLKFRLETKKKMLAMGIPKAVMDRLIADA